MARSLDPPSKEAPLPAVLRGADVIDGTGAARQRLDVAIAGGRIVGIGHELDDDFPEVDLTGLVLSPGFIDPHTHYDAQIFWDPDLTPSSWHGVTTVVTGNCGFTLAPTRPWHRDLILRTLVQVEGMTLEALEAGVQWTFESFSDYLRQVEALEMRLNVACLIGHSALRLFVLGDEASDREATPEEVFRMCELVREALQLGAVGFSTSKHNEVGAYGKPVPSRAASPDELMSIAGVLGETRRGTIQMVRGPSFSIDDAVHLAELSGGPVTWSGSELAPMAGLDGLAAAVRAVDWSTSRTPAVFPQFASRPVVQGVNLLDPFPFRTASEGFLDVLAAEPTQRLALYADEGWRRRTRAGLEPGWRQRLSGATIEETSSHTTLLNGPTLGELASREGKTPFDVMLDLALTDSLATRFKIELANTDHAVTRRLLKDRRCLLGLSDAGAHVTQMCDADYTTHLLAYWVREQQALSLEEAIWRLTSQPAAVYGLNDRGRIAVDTAADLVAFDPSCVGPGERERLWDFPGGTDRLVVGSTGVECVWVNGTPTRQWGKDLDAKTPGRQLRGVARPCRP
jgi:N-acyl-D-amino-acid deacylase